MNSGYRQSAIGNCESCDSTGFRRVNIGSYQAVVRCDHGRSKLEAIGSSIHRVIGSLADAALLPHDRQIESLIAERVGQKQAIRIRDLCHQVWPEEMADPKQFDRLARAVKESVERLRTFQHLAIAATKVPPYGYFLPETAEECDAAYNRYVREGIRLFLLARLFKPRADLVQALRGQLELIGPSRSDRDEPIPRGA
jgi:hypothetical protein